MRPKFDNEEEYIVAYYRQYSKSGSARSHIQDVITVAFGTALFALGYYKNDITWSVIGLGFVVYIALKGLFSGARYNQMIANIIQKYEDALEADNHKSKSERDAP
jgi:hypothetical protein